MRATRLPKLLLKALRADANSQADVPLTVEAIASQSGNLLEAKNSSGTVKFKVGADGIAVPTAASLTEAMLAAASGFGLGVLRTARAKYDFAVDGGAQGAITPATNSAIPDNAIILFGLANSTTAATSGGAATIAIGTTAGSSASSLKAAEAVATFGADALVALIPVMSAASAVKMSAAGQIELTVATADLTAGVIEITVVYIVAAA